MEKPSVTLRHDTAWFLAGFVFIITAVGVALSCVMPADQESRQVSFAVAILGILFCTVCVYWGTSTETLDENGILIKRPFWSKQYSWSDVTKVSVEVGQQYKRKGPEFQLKIKNRKVPLLLEYTKRSMACITCYYGQPDQDKWGKPPTIM